MIYDYIITGSGCAGLSLLMRLLQTPQLQHKKILVIDKEQKIQNDRTWCFWEKENGLFENIVHHRWQQLNFKSDLFSSSFSIAPYKYKMIRGIDFYNAVMQAASAFPNVEFKYETIKQLKTENNKAVVVTTSSTYVAEYIFNSVLLSHPSEDLGGILQHFKGWLIKIEQPLFNSAVADFMDFTISQQHGTTFMYVLPTGTNTALIEYTLFTGKLLQPQNYDASLKNYINQQLGIQNFEIVHEEFGIIPMTTHSFKQTDGNIVNIGTAGGDTKGSSGYTFQFIQKRTAQIVASLIKQQHPFNKFSFSKKKFKLYDDVLLYVLQNKKMNGDAIFAHIFKKNKPQTVLQFLDNETNLFQDLKIMSSVPMKIFLPAALRKIFQFNSSE